VDNKLLAERKEGSSMNDLNAAIKASFGEKMKLARTMAGYSRQKLSEELGISSKTIQSWETGRTFPENMSLIPLIEKRLGFFIPNILGETVREEVEKASSASKSKPKKNYIIRRAVITDEEEKEPEIKTEEIDEV